MLGDKFIAQHILNELKRENEEKAYRIYVTDALYAMINGGKMKKRFVEFLDKPYKSTQPERTIGEMLDMLKEVK